MLVYSLSWKWTVPNPISEASTVPRKGYFVLGIMSSGTEVKQFLLVEENVVDLVYSSIECFPVRDHRRV